jgi:photosystem II stability/assembly factor-like uncharacterized protein
MQSSNKKRSFHSSFLEMPQEASWRGLTVSFTISTFARRFPVMIFVVASVLVFMQSPRPNALQSPRRVFSTAWWRYPLEWNAPSRLAKIECGLNTIYAVPNTTHIWAAGNKGMVVASADGGQTWTKKGIEQQQVTLAPSPSPSPAPSPSRSQQQQTTSSLSASPASAQKTVFDLPDLIPTAEAAAMSRHEPQKPIGQPTQTTLPTPTPTILPRNQSGPPATPTPRVVSRTGVSRPQPTPTPTRSLVTPLASPTPIASPISSGGGTSSWPFETPSEVGPLIAIQFVDQSRGEAVNNIGWRYTTTDGGASWNPNLINLSFSLKPLAVSSLDVLVYRYSRYSVPFSLRFLQLPAAGAAKPWYLYVRDGTLVYSDTNGDVIPPSGMLEPQSFMPIAAQYSPSDNLFWVVGSKGVVYRTRDLSSDVPWQKFDAQSPDDLHSVFFLNENRGWVAGANGTIRTTNDGGTTWQQQQSGTKSQLNSINFLADGQHGWIAGNDGLILSTEDGGATWVHRTQGVEGNGGRYFRFPAPWYFLSLFLVAGLLGPAMWRRAEEPEEPPEESVADVLVSDRPLEEASGDVLAFNAIARGLSQFFRNENTLPPLTIAVIGEWGTGKSSLMNLLRADLRSFKFRPVWFNAWHHQKEEHMLASLLENIKLQAVPRWWTTRGMFFRTRLLKIRGWRQWGPVVLLLFGVYVVLVYHFVMHGAYTELTNFARDVGKLLGNTEGSEKSQVAEQYVRTVPLVVSLAPFIFAVWKGMTAFGVKPASLLANVSSGVNIRGLEAQTSFRQKFAVEFNDVTQALGKRSMLIFIDDLDRCRPENVLETLEAVNFLTTSGDCFVVIGMAREYVERCVGRAFKEVAEEMIDEVPDQSLLANRGKDAAQLKEDVAKEKRIEFARQYLDKLINIEVPVPAPKQSQSLALLVASTSALQQPTATTSLQRLKLWLVNLVEQHWRLAPAILALAGLLVVGYYVARGLHGNTENVIAPPALATTVPTPSATATPTPAPSPTPKATPTVTPSPSPSPRLTPASANEQQKLTPGGRAVFSPGVFPVAALLILIWIGAAILTRRPGLVVKDSPTFVEALEIWHPVVFARQSTPRATKRFMNHVRYLAMRQRRPHDSQPPVKRFTNRLKERLTGVPTPVDIATVPEPNVQIIPDEVLVALAAIQHLNPECLKEQPSPKGSVVQVWPRPVDEQSPYFTFFDNARTAHEQKFGNWNKLNQYRERFLEMTANVQVR